MHSKLYARASPMCLRIFILVSVYFNLPPARSTRRQLIRLEECWDTCALPANSAGCVPSCCRLLPRYFRCFPWYPTVIPLFFSVFPLDVSSIGESVRKLHFTSHHCLFIYLLFLRKITRGINYHFLREKINRIEIFRIIYRAFSSQHCIL